MKRDQLSHAVRARLVRLPSPYQAHYGVVPLPPPEEAISLQLIMLRHGAANAALIRVATLAGELADPYLISRILPRREAVSSSAMEGTNSTLDELLSIEETETGGSSDAVAQVRDYAQALDRLLPHAAASQYGIFTTGLVLDLHAAVIRGDRQYADVPGALRSRVVWIGGGDIAYSTITRRRPPMWRLRLNNPWPICGPRVCNCSSKA
jgi:Fic family protein